MSPQTPSKTLIKLIDLAIIPATLLIFVKLVSIVLLNAVLNLSWDLSTLSNAFFGMKLSYASPNDLILVISYSDLFMHLAALTGTILAMMKLFYLHPSHVKPSVVLHLAKKDRLHFIQSTFHLYHEAAIWGLFLVISDILIVFNYVQDLTYPWILGFVMVTTLSLLFILVRSIDRDLSYKNLKLK